MLTCWAVRTWSENDTILSLVENTEKRFPAVYSFQKNMKFAFWMKIASFGNWQCFLKKHENCFWIRARISQRFLGMNLAKLRTFQEEHKEGSKRAALMTCFSKCDHGVSNAEFCVTITFWLILHCSYRQMERLARTLLLSPDWSESILSLSFAVQSKRDETIIYSVDRWEDVNVKETVFY